jgi:hypothetical protein
MRSWRPLRLSPLFLQPLSILRVTDCAPSVEKIAPMAHTSRWILWGSPGFQRRPGTGREVPRRQLQIHPSFSNRQVVRISSRFTPQRFARFINHR